MQAIGSEHGIEDRQEKWAIARVLGGTAIAFVALFVVAALVHPPLMDVVMSMASAVMR